MKDFSWGHSLISRDKAHYHYRLLESLATHNKPFPSALSPNKVGRLLSDSQITKHGQGLVTFPWLSPEYCDWLSTYLPSEAYVPNSDEPYAAQIPEVVLYESRPDLHQALEQLYDMTIRPLVHLLTGSDVAEFQSIQLARYEPTRQKEGCFHTDLDSDITVTVVLNDDYVGGGLEVYPHYGIADAPEPVVIPKLVKGTATVFKGKTMLHKGLAVESGVKHLLVFWMTT